jgi:dihydroorotase
METLILNRPDDCHLHIRQGDILKNVLPYTVRQFARAVIMPNLKPPVTTVPQALAYRDEILAALPVGRSFTPLMTLYLTAATTIDDIKRVSESDCVVAFKLYPAGATTNSESGVSDVKAIYPLFEALEKYDVPLLIHGEVNDERCDIFDRERVFIDLYLEDMAKSFPALRMVLEHITTQEGVAFVESAAANVVATITPQHLLFNRNAMLAGGIKPHYYCLPILKRESHRLALIKAATSGNSKFFLGTDSAPHLTSLKESNCGCAGCFSAFAAIELYALAFESAGALDKLNAFASFFGADFYRLPRNVQTMTLQKKDWKIPCSFEGITPLKAGETLSWQLLSI